MAGSKALGFSVLAVIIVIFAIIVYSMTGFKSITGKPTTSTSKSSVPATTTEGSTTIMQGAVRCDQVYVGSSSYDTVLNRSCYWDGGTLALWAASGNSSFLNISILQNYTAYANINATHSCATLYDYYNLTAGNYTVEVVVGPEGAAGARAGCTTYFAAMNTSTSPKGTVYDILNGNFSTGTYAAWQTEGKAFGSAPLNLQWADDHGCYPQAEPWRGFNGSYFATTYNCTAHLAAAGNLTSYQFVVTKPFLNFQIISGSPRTYIELLSNGNVEIRAYFSTYQLSGSGSRAFTLRNATIPLTTLYGKSVELRIVANETSQNEYIVAGNFRLSDNPNQQQGILTNISFGG